MPEEEMDIQKLAAYANEFFESRRKGEGENAKVFYTMTDRHPQWIHDMVFKVHDNGEWLPNDYKYEYIVDALNALGDGVDPEAPEFEADVYNSDLIDWLGSHNFRPSYVDEAMADFGMPKKPSIIEMIQWGQIREKEEVFFAVVHALEERLGAIERGESEVFVNRGGGPEGVLDWEPRA